MAMTATITVPLSRPSTPMWRGVVSVRHSAVVKKLEAPGRERLAAAQQQEHADEAEDHQDAEAGGQRHPAEQAIGPVGRVDDLPYGAKDRPSGRSSRSVESGRSRHGSSVNAGSLSTRWRQGTHLNSGRRDVWPARSSRRHRPTRCPLHTCHSRSVRLWSRAVHIGVTEWERRRTPACRHDQDPAPGRPSGGCMFH